jgi:hypothetical protein
MSNINQTKPAENSSHTTSTKSLIGLALLTILIAGITLAMAQPEERTSPNQTTQQKSQNTNNRDPIRDIAESKTAENILRSLPADLPISSSYRIVDSSRTQGADFTQNIVRFETADTITDIFDRYQNWAQQTDLRVGQVNQSAESATIAIGDQNSQLYVAITDLNNSRRVEINHVRN